MVGLSSYRPKMLALFALTLGGGVVLNPVTNISQVPPSGDQYPTLLPRPNGRGAGGSRRASLYRRRLWRRE